MEFDNPREEYVKIAAFFEKAAGGRRESGGYCSAFSHQSGGRGACWSLDGVPDSFYHERTVAQSVPALDQQKPDGISENGSRRQGREKLFLEIMNRPNRYIARDALTQTTISFLH